MKRIRTVGLSLVAAFALSALWAASATALEYKACIKGAPGSGEFSDKGCTTAAAGGKYKLGSATGSTFAAKAKKPLNQLVNPGTNKVEGFFEAKKSSSAGSITGSETSEFVETFAGVKTNEGTACNSAGQGSGTIVTHQLGTKLVPLGAGSGQGELVFAAAGPTETLATYECGGVSIKVHGAVIAEIKGLSGAANKKFSIGVRARGGTPGNLQEFLYPGGAGTEAEEDKAQDFFLNFVPKLTECLEDGFTKAQCTEFNEPEYIELLKAEKSESDKSATTQFVFEEGEPPAQPDTLLSEIGAPLNVTAPAVQNATGSVKGKTYLKIA